MLKTTKKYRQMDKMKKLNRTEIYRKESNRQPRSVN